MKNAAPTPAPAALGSAPHSPQTEAIEEAVGVVLRPGEPIAFENCHVIDPTLFLSHRSVKLRTTTEGRDRINVFLFHSSMMFNVLKVGCEM